MVKVFTDERGSVRNGWKVLAYLLATTGVTLAFDLILYPLQRARGAFHLVVPDQWLGAAGALLVAKFALQLEEESFASLGLQWDRRFARDLLFGTFGGASLIGLSALLVRVAGGFHLVRNPGVEAGALFQGAWFYLAVACCEELLFRGYAFQRTVRGLGFSGAQALFAALFALSHWANPGMHGATKAWATATIGLTALLLAFCWRRTGSLALPIGVHLGWNWTQGTLLGFGVSGASSQGWWSPMFQQRPDWLTGGAFGLEASLPCALVTAGAILALWRWKGTSAGASTASAS
jgi:membrane protease YdiL (CAAX protease family)